MPRKGYKEQVKLAPAADDDQPPEDLDERVDWLTDKLDDTEWRLDPSEEAGAKNVLYAISLLGGIEEDVIFLALERRTTTLNRKKGETETLNRALNAESVSLGDAEIPFGEYDRNDASGFITQYLDPLFGGVAVSPRGATAGTLGSIKGAQPVSHIEQSASRKRRRGAAAYQGSELGAPPAVGPELEASTQVMRDRVMGDGRSATIPMDEYLGSEQPKRKKRRGVR